MNVKTLNEICTKETIVTMQVENCSNIPTVKTLKNFLTLVNVLASNTRSHGMWHIQLGGMGGIATNTPDNSNDSSDSDTDGVGLLDRLVLMNSFWSYRIYDGDLARLSKSTHKLQKVSQITLCVDSMITILLYSYSLHEGF